MVDGWTICYWKVTRHACYAHFVFVDILDKAKSRTCIGNLPWEWLRCLSQIQISITAEVQMTCSLTKYFFLSFFSYLTDDNIYIKPSKTLINNPRQKGKVSFLPWCWLVVGLQFSPTEFQYGQSGSVSRTEFMSFFFLFEFFFKIYFKIY